MNRMLCAGALALAAASATAADIPPAPPIVKAPVVTPLTAYDWTGFYIGINGGGAWGQSSFDGPTGTGGNFNTSGWVAGGTAGYNLQYGRGVFGLEGDVDWSNISGSAPCVGGAAICQMTNDWLRSARGRAGLPLERVPPVADGAA